MISAKQREKINYFDLIIKGLGPLILALIAYQGLVSNNRVEIVRIDLQKTENENKIRSEENAVRLQELKVTGDKTHKLVNSGALFQLRLYARLLRRVADEGKMPEDIKLAEEAEEEYRMRLKAQKEEQDKEASHVERLGKTMDKVEEVAEKVNKTVDDVKEKLK